MLSTQETKTLLLKHVENEQRNYWPKCHKSDDYIFKYDREIFETIYNEFSKQMEGETDPHSVFTEYINLEAKFEMLWENRCKNCMWLSKKEQQIETKIFSYPQDQLDNYVFDSQYRHFFYPGNRANKQLKQLASFTSHEAKHRSDNYRKKVHHDVLNNEEYIAIVKQTCQFLSRFLCIASSFASDLAEIDVALVRE